MATIQSLEIRDFKILKNRTIIFENGINKILGGNSCGKSTVGAALRFVMDCKEKNPKQAPNGNVNLVLRRADGSLQSYEKVKEGTRVTYQIDDDRFQTRESYKDSLASHGITADFALNIAANEDWHNIFKLPPKKTTDFIASFVPSFAELAGKIKTLKRDIKKEAAPHSQLERVLMESQKRELEALEQELQGLFKVEITQFNEEVNRLLTLLNGDDSRKFTLTPINDQDASKGVKASLTLNNKDVVRILSGNEKRLVALAFMLGAMSRSQAKFIILDDFDRGHFHQLALVAKDKFDEQIRQVVDDRYQLIATSIYPPFGVGHAIELSDFQ